MVSYFMPWTVILECFTSTLQENHSIDTLLSSLYRSLLTRHHRLQLVQGTIYQTVYFHQMEETSKLNMQQRQWKTGEPQLVSNVKMVLC